MASSTLLSPLATAVREVLSGRTDGQSDVARAIGRPAGAAGWFAPGDAIWTVHGSVATFVGGIRSLYLQALHPLAMAGIDRHSTYREDPFGRLQRTGAFIAATTYGSADLAQQTVDAVRVMHRRVQGTAPDGRAYSAGDPRLLEWVHIALVDSMLSAYQCLGREGAVDPDAYVADMAVVGTRMGVADPPRSVGGLAERFADFGPELRVDDVVHRTHRFVTEAPLPLALRPGYRVLARAAWATQPSWALEMLDSAPRRRTLHVGAADAALRVLRVALVASPARLAGERRLEATGPDAGDGRLA
ncbi:MAG: oxygenase MpaB family protein [Candidatus Nanopelagicales bacterium]